MEKYLVAILFVGVLSSSVSADIKSFLAKIPECSQQYQNELTSQLPNLAMCNQRTEFFKCIRDVAEETSIDYNFDDVENMQDQMCTEGVTFNDYLVKYQPCVYTSPEKYVECSHEVIDFMSHHNDPENHDSTIELSKLVCQKTDEIKECLYDVIRENCGQAAVDFIERVSKPSYELNKKICHDLFL